MSFGVYREYVQDIKNRYPVGTKVVLEYMEDDWGPPVGSIGIVRHVDDIGTIHVAWETGGSLGLVPGVDRFRVVE